MRTILRRWMAYTPPRGQFGWTVLVLAVPVLLFMVAGPIGGGGDLGTPELAFRALLWIVGLTFVWVVPLVRHMIRPRAVLPRER